VYAVIHEEDAIDVALFELFLDQFSFLIRVVRAVDDFILRVTALDASQIHAKNRVHGLYVHTL